MNADERIGANLIWLSEVDSTNTYLKDRMDDPAFSHGTAVFTDCQTAGKGRRGKASLKKFLDGLIILVEED